MGVIKNNYSQSGVYNVIYSSIRGVDFSQNAEHSSRSRLAYAENLYRDYDGDGGPMIESIPGFRKIFSAGERINGIFSFGDEDGQDHLVIHAGGSLFKCPVSLIDSNDIGKSLCSLCDRRSQAFKRGYALYILDGEGIVKVTKDSATRVSDGTDTAPYVPTTYVNGKQHEQLNLLSKYFNETYITGSARSLAGGCRDLEYEITDEQDQKCTVVGIKADTKDLVIPALVTIGDKEYSVTQIGDYAFADNTEIETVEIPNGITRIGTGAFSGNISLRTVFMKDSVELIEGAAFNACSSLQAIYLGAHLREFGAGVFSMCTGLKKIYYAASPESFSKIINNSVVNSDLIEYHTRYRLFRAYVPVHTPSRRLASVTIDGEPHIFNEEKTNGVIRGINMLMLSEAQIVGKEIRIVGEVSEYPEDHTEKSGFLSSAIAAEIGGVGAIGGMTIAESYDGRIFLSGNPKVPGGCFYSSEGAHDDGDALYFGDHDYWIEGDGIFNTSALLATSDSLAVFNSSSASGGGIFYHTPKDTSIDMIPKIYPLSYSHLGMSASTSAICFYDDPVFISSIGISALSKQDLAMGRKIRTRSSRINSMLLSEDLTKARLAVWCGYLVVAVGEHIYLADSRATFSGSDGSLEYEWFFLNGIGTYQGDMHTYRYSSIERGGCCVHNCADCEIGDPLSVGSAYDENGDLYYYCEENGIRYAAERSEKMTGGTFYPLTEICTVGDRLFFGTECGDVCVFNNDMRGIAPEHIRRESDFDEKEYKRIYGRRIHPSYYSFAGHSARYALKTPWDNGGIPHLLKNTDKKSATVKCRAFSGGAITFEVGTDSSGYREICRFPSSSFSFSDIDFSSLGLGADDSFTALLSEREKGWIEKQTALYSDEFCSPIGIYNVAYRFTIRGKLKTSI